jgi:hypothetical protein
MFSVGYAHHAGHSGLNPNYQHPRTKVSLSREPRIIMSESVQLIFDINATGNPFTSPLFECHHTHLNNFAGLPQEEEHPTHTPPTRPPEQAPTPTLLNRFSNFFCPHFCPRSTAPADPIPMQANHTFGDKMMIPIETATTQLYFINLNGINLDKKEIKFRDLFTAAEHNLDKSKFGVRQSLQTISQQ